MKSTLKSELNLLKTFLIQTYILAVFIKLFTDLIFCIFHEVKPREIYFPRWMEIVWLPSASELRSVALFTWPNLNMSDLKTTLSSGFSKLGLCSTTPS